MSRQEKLRKQNKELRSTVDGYVEEIDRLKKVNEQHEAQIETLLKFNERLLVIIETELNSYNSRKSERSLSLQPISEITEKDSEAFQAIGSIKASILNSIRLAELEPKEETEKKTGNETDRVMLGENLSDALSYEVSRSDYQREYTESNKKEKMKEVMALINAYKQEYGETIREYDEINSKIKEDAKMGNLQIENLNSESSCFYGNKLAQLTSLRQKVSSSTPQKELQKMIDANKYSASTQTKLIKIISAIK